VEKDNPMAVAKQCPECGGAVYKSSPVTARGGYGPDLLPGLSRLFTSATFIAAACSDCGLTRYYATREALGRMAGSDQWTRVL
jgi:predicted nucleic-acid-binding Zn-ribbon protein